MDVDDDVVSCDVVVVGGGIAGLVAATRAAQTGLDVAVLEKGDTADYLCNSRFTGGAFHVCYRNVTEDASALREDIFKSTHGFADARLAAGVASDARTAVAWLKLQGVRFIKSGPDPWQHNFLAPPSLLQPGLNWKGRGGDVMLRTLRGRLEAMGGRLLQGARARGLLMDGNRCRGVRMERAGRAQSVQADNVVLCDGGFQANPALLREYITPAPEKLKQRGAATGHGDALLMARDAGAALVGMEKFYGHLLSQEALEMDSLWPYPTLDRIAGAGIVVNRYGRRFMDEGLGGVFMANCIARLQDPLSTVAIFDRKIWEGPATDHLLPPNPHLVLSGGSVIAAKSLDDLAARLHMPGEPLKETVAQFNAAVQTGTTGMLEPRRSSLKTAPHPVLHAPYYAVRLVAGITYTMGGLAIDDMGRVLNERGDPIPGLFASGCTTGGLEGGAASGYVGGLAKSASISMRVGNALAALRQSVV